MRKIEKVISAAVLLLAIIMNETGLAQPVPGRKAKQAAEADTALQIQTVREGELTIYKIEKYNTLVVKIPRISSFLYMTRPEKSLEQIAKDSSFSLVVNSSYFDNLYADSAALSGLYYRHAGYLKIKNKVYSGIKKNDRQILRLFAYDSRKNKAGYFSLNELARTKNYDLVAQIGPQIIRKNKIDTAGIDASINGNQQTARTAFASAGGNEFYIIVALPGPNQPYSSGISLRDLGKMLLSSGLFGKDFDVINFDGGASTSIYVKNHPEFCWHAGYILPNLICVK